MLHFRLVDQVLFRKHVAQGGIDNLFLDLGVDGQFGTDHLRQFLLLFKVVVLYLLELRENLADLPVVRRQDGNRVLAGCRGAACH